MTVQRTTPAAAASAAAPGGAEAAQQRGAEEKEDEDLDGDLLRPQQARGPSIDPGGTPADHCKRVVQGMTAEHQRADQQETAVRRDGQQQ
jgi:hypothetical protein